MSNVFIISKPLQYFNASNISTTIGQRVLLIVDDFFNAKEVYLALKEKSLYWDKIYFFDVWTDAYNWVLKNKSNIESLFIDADHGFTKYLYLRKLQNLSIYVYEEGIGNYRKTLNKESIAGRFKRVLYEKVLGHKVYLGGCNYTRGIYLYDKNRFLDNHPYNKKEILSFKYSFNDHLNRFKDKDVFLSSSTFEFIENSENKLVVLYLSSWEYDSKVEDIINKYDGYSKVLKLHPHIKKAGSYKYKYDFIIPNNDLIELVIKELLEKYEKIVILHHGSSAIMYFADHPKLEIIEV